MSSRKIRLGILCGGKSAEHEISLTSANSVIHALDKNKYDITLIGIDKKGGWHLRDTAHFLQNAQDPKRIHFDGEHQDVAITTNSHEGFLAPYAKTELQNRQKLDVIFPVLHGTYGEDGTVQGLLKLLDMPFVGAGVLGSAVGMDKDVMKRLLRDANIPIAKFITLHKHERAKYSFNEVKKMLGLPLFVKPANLGSSVGISKVKNEQEFNQAIEQAFLYDRKILIEEAIKGRELECAVLGNDHPIASLPGELTPTHEFYSYEAKYLDNHGAEFTIPVKLSDEKTAELQTMAIAAFQALCCEGMARVDFFMKDDGELLINEINTIPGFTSISMYPKLWAASGIPYPELLDRLIQLAQERHQEECSLKTSC